MSSVKCVPDFIIFRLEFNKKYSRKKTSDIKNEKTVRPGLKEYLLIDLEIYQKIKLTLPSLRGLPRIDNIGRAVENYQAEDHPNKDHFSSDWLKAKSKLPGSIQSAFISNLTYKIIYNKVYLFNLSP